MQDAVLKARRPAIARQCEAELGARQKVAIVPGGVLTVAVPHVVLALPVLLLCNLINGLADTSIKQ